MTNPWQRTSGSGAGRTKSGLEKLRLFRTRPDPQLSISPGLDKLTNELRSKEQKLGKLQRAWIEVAPPAIVDEIQLVAFRAGVLSVRVRSAPVKHILDRFLRTGGIESLSQAGGVPVNRVKTTR